MQKSRAMHRPRSARTTLPTPAPLLPKAAGLIQLISVIQKANCQSRWSACFLPSLVMQISTSCQKNDNFRFPSCTWMKKALVLKTCKVIYPLYAQAVRAASYTLSLANALHARPRARGQRLHQTQFWCTLVSDSIGSFHAHCLIPGKPPVSY